MDTDTKSRRNGFTGANRENGDPGKVGRRQCLTLYNAPLRRAKGVNPLISRNPDLSPAVSRKKGCKLCTLGGSQPAFKNAKDAQVLVQIRPVETGATTDDCEVRAKAEL